MAFPSCNAILRGIFFIVALTINLMCESWMLRLKVEGNPMYLPHVFNHVFLLWTFKQGLLASMYVLWKAINQNWLGMARFQHAQIDVADIQPHRRRYQSHHLSRNPSVNADAEDSSLIPSEGPLFKRKQKDSYSKLLFLLPSICSQAHILFIYFGLKLTYNSSVIMLTGTSSLVVSILSLAFLAKPISRFMWLGVSVSTFGFAITGLSDYLHNVPRGYEPYGIAAGDLLFVLGQMTMTTQMVYEEKYMRKYSIHPMKFLGSEGIYSLAFSLIMLLSFSLSDIPYSDLPNNRIEDISDAALQFANSWQVILAVFGSLISYAVFTYLGMILIKDHGAMSRIMIEALAWCLFWVIMVSMKWQSYYITQIPGLVLIPVGVLIFSHIVVCPCCDSSNATLDYAQADRQNNFGDGSEGNLNGGIEDDSPSTFDGFHNDGLLGAVGGVEDDALSTGGGNNVASRRTDGDDVLIQG